jgi:hypothetical protein
MKETTRIILMEKGGMQILKNKLRFIKKLSCRFGHI